MNVFPSHTNKYPFEVEVRFEDAKELVRKYMKKTFNLTAPNKKPARQVDSVIHEIRKYLKRERRKTLPENVDYWDFDCRIGNDAGSASSFKLESLNASIDAFVMAEKKSFYIEILAKHGFAEKKKEEES